ncbi:voltage-dependent anion-selective channel [Drosophila busckii]|nr:voltage-dependent anion-selective channel [Drosophila busckii]
MVPPPYVDLGKLARDLFKRGYHPGLWQLDCRTMTNSGIEFFTTGFASQDASKVMGSLQSKYKVEDYGLTLTERWNTDNLLYGEIMQREKLAEGLMLALEGKFQPSSGDKSGKFKFGYGKESFHLQGDVEIASSPPINLSLVLAHNEFLAGVGIDFKTSDNDVGWKAALGWKNESTVLHAETKNADAFLFSVFHKASDKIDAAAEIVKAAGGAGGGGVEGGEQQEAPAGGGDWTFGVGMIYHLDGDALIRAKVNSNVEIGLGYEQKLREGITMSISTVLEGKNLSDGNHKFGVGLALEC